MAGKRSRDRQLAFFVMARTEHGHYPHPVEVAVHPDGVSSRLSFSIGPHAANAGGQIALARVLDEQRTGLNPMFATEFDAAELHWLVPYLVRLQAGEDVKDEMVAAYAAQHGRSPEVLWQQHYGE
ncbi:hypothetical protein [Aeromicrobium sp. JJY06]|uniref:hypothetical protein n=1 Tax=Aeromicrobium sp. JJY06 TaxID=3373478 RepID=UPI00376ED8FD